jgi:hypothetical protein
MKVAITGIYRELCYSSMPAKEAVVTYYQAALKHPLYFFLVNACLKQTGSRRLLQCREAKQAQPCSSIIEQLISRVVDNPVRI